MKVRPMQARDVSQVVQIEEAVSAIPWPRHMLNAELGRPGTIDLVAVEGGVEVVGYLLASRYADVWHVLNVAVRPDRRRRGLGRRLMNDLFELAGLRPHLGYTLEVRVGNEGAIRLYTSLGFVEHGVRRGYYSDNKEDALVMWRSGDPEDQV
ncbi:MAG: ribosomal protein S18-alanine N-acetyltransferase [Thermoleophilia bacterium]